MLPDSHEFDVWQFSDGWGNSLDAGNLCTASLGFCHLQQKDSEIRNSSEWILSKIWKP